MPTHIGKLTRKRMETVDKEVTDERLPVLLAREFQNLLPLVRWLNGALGLPA